MVSTKDALELLDAELARLEQTIDDLKGQLGDLAKKKSGMEEQFATLKEFREKLVASGRPRVTSLTAEVRRLLTLRPRSNDELATELQGRMGQRPPKEARRLVFATVNQMRHQGQVERDERGINRLKQVDPKADGAATD